MLGSFNSEADQDDPSLDLHHHHHHHHHFHQLPPPPSPHSPATHMRQLLISCAELLSQSDFSAAHRLLSILSSTSPYGDSTDRLVHQFSTALSLRLRRLAAIGAPADAATVGAETATLHSSYLSLNQITPFIRFSHLTANQAILEAIEGHQAIHILDFDIMHGVQWPPLMQAIAERSSNLNPPPTIRITGTGADINILHRTGDRLLKFAQSLGLKFHFHPLLLNNDDPFPSAIAIVPEEAIAVNCILYLHRLLKDDSRDLRLFLHQIKCLNPKVFTIAEREASHNRPLFLQRFVEALDHYAAIFDSLEATLPPNSRERLAVEQIWFGREIMDIVAAEGDGRRERHERFQTWEVMLRGCGFNNVPLSPFALSQAKLLLRLHYPSEGFQLQILHNSLFLGWQNRALFSVSSWH